MTRRPSRDRPPRLPDAPAAAASRPTRPPTIREQLVDGRVTGPHARLGRAEVAQWVRDTVVGAQHALLGIPSLAPLTPEDAWKAVDLVWGWSDDRSRAAIDPDRTLAGAVDGFARIVEAARAGARLTFATTRPASLLPLHQALARAARAAGARMLEQDRYGRLPSRRGALELWWHDGVAVVTDGSDLVGEDAVTIGEEWLFAVGRSDLVVADRGFAGAAVAAGHETVAFADLDAVALGVAATRGLPAHLVPLDEQRPPAAYAALLELVP